MLDELTASDEMDELTAVLTQKVPSWMDDARSYLLGFAHHRHEASDDAMPQDRRILRAIRRLYRDANEADRQIMRGTFEGDRTEQKARFFRLCCLLAVEAGLCTACIVPATWEETISGDDPEQKKGDINHELS